MQWFSFKMMHFKMHLSSILFSVLQWVNTLRPRQNGCHFPKVIFKCIFLNKNIGILIKILLKFSSKGPINNIPALVQIMAWCRPGDKPLSEPMMVSLLEHIWVIRPQWIKMMTNLLLHAERLSTNMITICNLNGLLTCWLPYVTFIIIINGNLQNIICMLIFMAQYVARNVSIIEFRTY